MLTPGTPVLVTGAFGSLGRAVVRELAARGHPVRAFDVPTAAHRLAALRLRRTGLACELAWGDITRAADVARAVKGVAGVIHNAGVLPPASERWPERAHAVNVGGLENLLAALVHAPVPLVYPSSFTVFGCDARDAGLATSASPVRASDHYTAHKLACEARLRASSVPFVILRLAAAIDSSPGATDPAMLRLMFEIDPEQPIELVHSDDAARAEVAALSCAAARGRVLLVGGGARCRVRQRDLLALLARLLCVEPWPARAFGRLRYYTSWLDSAESEALLGYQRRGFEDIAAELAQRVAPARPLLRLVRPLARALVLRLSGPYRGRPPARRAADVYAP